MMVEQFTKVKGKVFYGQEPPSGESTTTEYGVNYKLLAVIYWSSPMEELLVVVDHNRLRKMASETEYPIDWSHSPPSRAVPPEHLVHSTNRYSLQLSACEATTLRMRPNSSSQTNIKLFHRIKISKHSVSTEWVHIPKLLLNECMLSRN